MSKKRTSLRKKQDYQDRYIIRMQGGKTGLVEATSKMDIHEFRVFMTMLTMVLPDDEDFVEYEIRTQDIIKLYSLSDDGRYYEAIREAADRLFNKRFIIFEKKEDGEIYKTTIHLIDETSEPVKISEQNRIRLKFNPKLKPYLLQLQREYLTIDVRNIANIQSPNSVKLYLILKHQYNLGNRKVKYTVARLREILAISDDEYPLYGNFKQKIIQKGIKDLEKHTDLMVIKFEEEKVGRAIDTVVFFIAEKEVLRLLETTSKKLTRQVIKSSNGNVVVSSHTPEEIDVKKEITSADVVGEKLLIKNELNELYGKIKQYNISKSTLQKWFDSLPKEQVKLGIEYVLNRIKEGDSIKNVGGYINNMVTNPSLFETQQLLENEKINKQNIFTQELQKKQEKEDFEQRRNLFLNAYIAAKENLVVQLVNEENNIASELIATLQSEAQGENALFLAQMAWDSFLELRLDGSEIDKLLGALNLAGFSFKTYVYEWIGKTYPSRIIELKQQFRVGAKELDIELN